MKVFFSDRAFASVLAETTEKIKTETGGLFLGKVKDDSWYIVEAIDPGPKSVFEVAYFEYDKKYTQHLINKIANLYEEKLELIGLWHRHPGSFDQFSSTDDGTNAKYAAMRKDGAISGLVNIDPNFRFTMYHVASPCMYRKIPYEVGDNFIPDELLQFKTPNRFYELMQARLTGTSQRRNSGADYKVSVSLESFMKFILPYIDAECEEVATDNIVCDETAQKQLTESIIEDLSFMVDKIGIQVSVSIKDQFLIVFQEAVDKTTKIYFTYSDKTKQVIFFYSDKCYIYTNGLFKQASLKATADKDKQKSQKEETRKQSGIFNSVKKIIPFIKNEE